MTPPKVIVHHIENLLACSTAIVETDNILFRTLMVISEDTSVDILFLRQGVSSYQESFEWFSRVGTT
jgi:hypothetical protein